MAKRPSRKNTSETAQHERDRRVKAIELITTVNNEIRAVSPPLSAPEVLSASFRQRGECHV